METGLWHGYLGTVRRKGRQQTNQTYGYRATFLLYHPSFSGGVWVTQFPSGFAGHGKAVAELEAVWGDLRELRITHVIENAEALSSLAKVHGKQNLQSRVHSSAFRQRCRGRVRIGHRMACAVHRRHRADPLPPSHSPVMKLASGERLALSAVIYSIFSAKDDQGFETLRQSHSGKTATHNYTRSGSCGRLLRGLGVGHARPAASVEIFTSSFGTVCAARVA